ncbi:MAG TPA: hypothetical protein VFM18_13835 [Methanosarcina sp.]|nr:hypothetical protein [Methanosarcina sp.]
MSDTNTTIQILETGTVLSVFEDAGTVDVIEVTIPGPGTVIEVTDSQSTDVIEISVPDGTDLTIIEDGRTDIIEIASSEQEIEVFDGTGYVVVSSGDILHLPAGSIPLDKLAVDPLARANHTGTQLSNTISDFQEAINIAFTNRKPILMDASRPIAYVGYVTRIVKLDYVVYPPNIYYYVTSNLEADWPNRTTFTYIPASNMP